VKKVCILLVIHIYVTMQGSENVKNGMTALERFCLWTQVRPLTIRVPNPPMAR